MTCMINVQSHRRGRWILWNANVLRQYFSAAVIPAIINLSFNTLEIDDLIIIFYGGAAGDVIDLGASNARQMR